MNNTLNMRLSNYQSRYLSNLQMLKMIQRYISSRTLTKALAISYTGLVLERETCFVSKNNSNEKDVSYLLQKISQLS